MILTLDLGTSAIKAAVWSDVGLVGLGRAPLSTTHPSVGWDEQDASTWWPAVVSACAAARASSPSARSAFAAVSVIGFSCARQTFVLTDAALLPLGPAILWSDQRGGGTVAGKLAWLGRAVASARWVLNPRDLIVGHMTGEVACDWTVASSSGLYSRDGDLLLDVLPDLRRDVSPGASSDVGRDVSPGASSDVGRDVLPGPPADVLPDSLYARILPPVVPPTTVVGRLLAEAAGSLGLPAGIPVVIGAGDRQCEVLGVAASASRPMVSWGTTANVSVPSAEYPEGPPEMTRGLLVHGGAPDGWLVEGGLSAAGAMLAWLGSLVGLDVPALAAEAAFSPPGARGVIALPWLSGARAPWWRPEVGAAFSNIRAANNRADLARAAIEGVAWEVDRCLRLAGAGSSLALSGGGAGIPVWVAALTGITGLPVVRRATDEGASAGAAVVAGLGVGHPVDIERLNPVESITGPDAADESAYAMARVAVERATAAALA